MNQTINKKIFRSLSFAATSVIGITLGIAIFVSGCGQEGGTNELIGDLRLDVPVAYVKRPLDDIDNEPTPGVAIMLKPGGNLFIRDFADPKSPEYNVTASFTAPIIDQNDNVIKEAGDVAHPDISYDGKKIVFAMHVGVYQDAVTNPTSWNLYEYTIPEDKDYTNPQNIQPVIPDTGSIDRELYNEFAPSYLPDGRVVFASDYLQSMQFKNATLYTGVAGSIYETENRQDNLVNLHVVLPNDSGSVEQITFNHSHDMYPSVLRTGEIIFSRWDNAYVRNNNLRKNHFSIYKINPDGTGFDVLYGAHSHDPANSAPVFLHPREMENGKIVATVMPRSGTYQGGELVEIDYQNFADRDLRKINASTTETVGQQSLTNGDIPTDDSLSFKGRYTTPFPLWDGSNRLLVAWAPCEVQDNQGQRFFCNDDTVDATDTNTYEPSPPAYGIWMFDPSTNTKKPIILREPGMAITNPVAVVDRFTLRNDPVVKPETTLDADAQTAGVGVIKIKSVYDTDSLVATGMDNRFSAQTTTDLEGRTIIDLAAVQLLDITQRAAFVRIVRPAPNVRSGNDINNNSNRMFDIVGYAPVQPDGSVVAEVPAGEPFAIEVLDSQGRRFAFHTAWLQVKAGEVMECNGCHSRRDGSAPLNAANPTMAEAVVEQRLDYRKLSPDLVYYDDWITPATPLIDIRYANRNTYPDMATDINPPFKDLGAGCETNWDITQCRISIEYVDHIQQLWERSRAIDLDGDMVAGTDEATCVTCHNENRILLDNMGMPVAELMGNIPLPPAGQLTLTTDGLNLSNRNNATEYNSYFEVAQGDRLQAVYRVNNNGPLLLNYLDIPDYDDEDGDLDTTELRRARLNECTSAVNNNTIQIFDPVTIDNGDGTTTDFDFFNFIGTYGVSSNDICGSGNPLGSGRFFTKMDGSDGTTAHIGLMKPEEIRLLIDFTQMGLRYSQDPTPIP